MFSRVLRLARFQEFGLVVVILLLGALLTAVAGRHEVAGHEVNRFLNASTLIQMATDASFFAIMAVGMSTVIITAGIDLSVGSTYALSGVLTALALRAMPGLGAMSALLIALALCCGFGLVCGLVNGAMVASLGVHPFVITLGTLWIYRGLAFVSTGGHSILMPDSLTNFVKSPLGLGVGLYPVPLLVMLVVTALIAVYLGRMVAGRRIFAVGGNVEASRYSGIRIGRVLVGVYAITGVCAGLAALLGGSFYGAVSSNDANGYELYVIAAAVVGGCSLTGGKGSAVGALLGSILIVMIRQSIRTLQLDQNYEWIIIGVAIIVAVVLDRLGTRAADRHLR